MPRVVAGLAKGRRLAVAPGGGTRPTADRAREALFSTLGGLFGPLTGAAVLDLYAGSGAVGLEALSRGAAAVLFVESDPRAVAVLRANVAAVGLPGARVSAQPVQRLAARPASRAYQVAALDPPYALPAERVRAVLGRLAGRGWLATGALLVLQRSSGDPPWRWPAGFRSLRSHRYGAASICYGRWQPDGDGPGPSGGDRRGPAL